MNIFLKAVGRLVLLLIVVAAVITPAVISLDDPMAAVSMFFVGPFGTLRNVGNIVETATPLLFTGLAVSLMFRAGMFNLGAEGAFFAESSPLMCCFKCRWHPGRWRPPPLSSAESSVAPSVLCRAG